MRFRLVREASIRGEVAYFLKPIRQVHGPIDDPHSGPKLRAAAICEPPYLKPEPTEWSTINSYSVAFGVAIK